MATVDFRFVALSTLGLIPDVLIFSIQSVSTEWFPPRTGRRPPEVWMAHGSRLSLFHRSSGADDVASPRRQQCVEDLLSRRSGLHRTWAKFDRRHRSVCRLFVHERAGCLKTSDTRDEA